jgi:hypothetical protein
VLVHVPKPDKECSEADYDEQLIPPRRNGIHNAKYELKEIANCIPETCPHNSIGICWRKNRKILK